MIPGMLKGLNYFLWLQVTGFFLRNTYGIEILPLILGQRTYILFLKLMKLFAGQLSGRKELAIPTWIAAERNALLKDGQMLLLAFCAVQKYLPAVNAACYSLQNFLKTRRNCVAGRGGLAAEQFHPSHWAALENAVTAPANRVLNALCPSSYKEDTWEQGTCFSDRVWRWLLQVSCPVEEHN